MLYAVAACTWRRVLSGENVIMFARTCLSGGTNARAQLSSNSRIAISCCLHAQFHKPGIYSNLPRQPMSSPIAIGVTVNGVRHEREVEPRLLLSDFIRQDLALTGTRVGCEHGVCGACTVLFDGEPIRSCIMLAVQADGHDLQTVEALAAPSGELNPLQRAFRHAHGLQCGFCTPGFLMTLTAFLRDNPSPTDSDIRDALSANLCRCTGYHHIFEAAKLASRATVP
jgi:carbon-monoxide dehydrogenase small subunit